MVKNFRNDLTKKKSNYRTTNFCMLGWINYGKKDWWASHTGLILSTYEARLYELGLYKVIKATQYGISNNLAQFFALLKMYCLSFGTFFMPHGKLGIGLHEIWMVLASPMGDYPYEEYFPTS